MKNDNTKTDRQEYALKRENGDLWKILVDYTNRYVAVYTRSDEHRASQVVSTGVEEITHWATDVVGILIASMGAAGLVPVTISAQQHVSARLLLALERKDLPVVTPNVSIQLFRCVDLKGVASIMTALGKFVAASGTGGGNNQSPSEDGDFTENK